MDTLKSFVASEDLSHVEVLGLVPHARSLELLRKARFLVIPSLWYEGFPMVIAEAFALKPDN